MIVNLLANKLNPCSTFSLNLSQSEARPAQNNLKTFSACDCHTGPIWPHDECGDFGSAHDRQTALSATGEILEQFFFSSSFFFFFHLEAYHHDSIMIKDQDQWSRIKDKDPESHVSHLCLLWLLPLYSIFHLTYLQHTLPTAFSAGKSRVFRENIQPWKSSKSWGVTKVRHYDCKVTFIDGNTPSNLFRGISYRLERLNRSTTYELVASVMNRWNISHFSIYQQFSIIILGISVTVGLTKETYSLSPRWIKVRKMSPFEVIYYILILVWFVCHFRVLSLTPPTPGCISNLIFNPFPNLGSGLK